MRRKNFCITCLEKEAGRSRYDLPVQLFAELQAKHSFTGDTCPECNGTNIQKILGMEMSYIRGHGFLDKTGVKRDMDLHTMVTGRDPYKEHRKEGESRDVILRLQQAKEHNTHQKTIHLGK